MKRFHALLAGVVFAVVAFATFTPIAGAVGDVVVVPLKPLGEPSGPFPIGWAALNIPKGNVTIMAILPKNTQVDPPQGDPPQGDPQEALVPRPEIVFEGWLVDYKKLPPPPPTPTPSAEVPGTIVVPDPIPLEAMIFNGTTELLGGGIVLGSPRSSETGFRGFPGLINPPFENTYFPVSQGLLRKAGLNLGDWQFYIVHHNTNMSLTPFDVVVVTVEPPLTGAPKHDYDPRPNPKIVLAGKIPPPPPPPTPRPTRTPRPILPTPTPNPNGGPGPGPMGGM